MWCSPVVTCWIVDGRPTTFTAMLMPTLPVVVWVPFPSSPEAFEPAHRIEPSFSSTQVLRAPHAICATRRWQVPSAQNSVDRQPASFVQAAPPVPPLSPDVPPVPAIPAVPLEPAPPLPWRSKRPRLADPTGHHRFHPLHFRTASRCSESGCLALSACLAISRRA